MLRRNGCEVKVVFVTDGAGAGTLPEGAAAIRRREAAAALAVLGVSDFAFLDEPDGGFHSTPRFERDITTLLQAFRPDWLFLPSVLDYHRDHAAIGQAILACWRRRQGSGQAFFYEIWSPLPATCVIDISDVADLKRSAISRYELPLAHCDYLSASLGLAAYRGLYLPGNAPRKYAEAFVAIENRGYWRGMAERMLEFRMHVERLLN
ncbi:PIG-L deacetylase family protein [Methylocaldum sp. MU1018]